jgi:menaquinone-dependent protoporphyrinogen IX oxidase
MLSLVFISQLVSCLQDVILRKLSKSENAERTEFQVPVVCASLRQNHFHWSLVENSALD